MKIGFLMTNLQRNKAIWRISSAFYGLKKSKFKVVTFTIEQLHYIPIPFILYYKWIRFL